MGLPSEVAVTVTLATLTCGECSIPFAIPNARHDRMKAQGESIYCPNGHSISYADTDVKRLTAQLEAERKRRVEQWERANRAEAAAAKAQRKLSRVGKGVCPWCKRSFQNLKRHVACKHAEKAKA